MFNIGDLKKAKQRLFEKEHDSTSCNLSETQLMVESMKEITMPTLILGVQSDILFPVWQQKVFSIEIRKYQIY
jgi:homoserine acetyltransferase